jgi:hypothetical protein
MARLAPRSSGHVHAAAQRHHAHLVRLAERAETSRTHIDPALAFGSLR